MSHASTVMIRFTLVLLFLWFGTQQLLDAETWIAFLPEWTGYLPIPGKMLVQINGLLEVLCAILLAAGVYTKIIAGLLGAHLLFIAISVGGPTGVRDAALALITLSLVFSEPDRWTLDKRV